MTEIEIIAAALFVIMALGLYIIIGIGILAFSSYYDYELLIVCLWPVMIILLLLMEFIEFVRDEILRR